jgi:hypothetical protein
MSTRLIEIPQSELHPTLRALSDAGATTEDADWIRSPGNAAKVVEFLLRRLRNPFRISIDKTVRRFRDAVLQEGWPVGEDQYAYLSAIAPEWPAGKRAFRSLRIRFGSGDDGIAQTFDAHAARIRKIFEPKFRLEKPLCSDKEHLRLLGNRNHAHKPVVEWVVFDLDANRKRSSIAVVRHPLESLVDEGLVFAWLFPEYVRAIDHKENPGFFLAGYELDSPKRVDSPWQSVPCVDRNLCTGEVTLHAYWRSNNDSDYSVPALLPMQ